MQFKIPTVRQYYVLKFSTSVGDVLNAVEELTGKRIEDPEELKRCITLIISWIDQKTAADPALHIPYAPHEEDDDEDEKTPVYYHSNTADLKAVSDYTGLDFLRLYEVDILTFKGWLRDAYVWSLNRSEKGREYLENAYLYTQTEPDRVGLREMFGGETSGE